MRKIAIAITGASGSIYAKMLIESLLTNKNDVEIYLVLSESAKIVWQQELNEEFVVPNDKRIKYFEHNNFFSPIASGSSDIQSMVICPCSMGTLGRINGGISDDLITRGSDVMLKEKKQLICVVRETPLNSIQLKNMYELSIAGAHILPAMPSFYNHPQSIEDLIMSVVNRILDKLNISNNQKRWGA